MEASEKTAWLSILVNLFLVSIKAGLALLTGSLAIKADAIHSLSDVVSSFVILVGIKISKRSSPRFPYGLYKIENLVALGMSLLILLAGYEIAREVLLGGSLVVPQRIPLAVAGILLTIVIAWVFSRYELWKGRETGSPSLIADAKHLWSDMLSSVVILVALVGSSAGLHLDRYAAMIVVVFIVRAALHVFIDAVRVLLDVSLDYDSLDQVRGIVLADPRVSRINELRGRNAGRYKFVELDICLRVKELAAGHVLAEEIKTQVKNGLENVDQVLVHFAPEENDHIRIAVPLETDRESISRHLGEAPFFQLLNLNRGETEPSREKILKNPFTGEPRARGMKVANWLLQQRIDVLLVRESIAGKGPAYILESAGVEVMIEEGHSLSTGLSAFRSGSPPA